MNANPNTKRIARFYGDAVMYFYAYLEVVLTVSGYDFGQDNESERATYAEVTERLGLDAFADGRSCTLTSRTPAATFLNANAIHTWFANRVAPVDGLHYGVSYPATIDQLRELAATCTQVVNSADLTPGTVRRDFALNSDNEPSFDYDEAGLVVADSGLAASLMPTTLDPWLGVPDYDESYIDQLRECAERIDAICTAYAALPDDQPRPAFAYVAMRPVN